MIGALVLAGALPCLAPITVHHKHHTLAPIQSCATPVMCFRDPPEVDTLILPEVVARYVWVGSLPVAGEGYSSGIGEYGLFEPTDFAIGGAFMSYSVPARQTPEIDPSGIAGSVTLLAGLLAVVRGRILC